MSAMRSTSGKWCVVVSSASLLMALGVVLAARDAAAVPAQEKPKAKGAVKGKGGPAGKRDGDGRQGGGMVQGRLVNVSPEGLVLQEGAQQRFVAIGPGTEVVLRGEADASALVPGAVVEISARPENPQGPVSVSSVTVLTGAGRPVGESQGPRGGRPGAAPGGAGTIRAVIVSREPLVISTNGRDKIPLQLAERTRLAVEVHGGDLRLCQSGDEVMAMLGSTQTARGPMAQRITITRGGNAQGRDRPKAKDTGKKSAEKKKKDQ